MGGSGLAALVVKPSACRGLLGLCRSAEVAAATDAKVVVSSAFESGVGVAGMAAIATWLDSAGVGGLAHGLGTMTWLRDDVVTEHPSGSAGLHGAERNCEDAAGQLQGASDCSSSHVSLLAAR